MKTTLLIILTLWSIRTLGQASFQEEDAIRICNYGHYDIPMSGSNYVGVGDLTCFPDEASLEHYQLLVIRDIVKGGTISFDLIPTNVGDDIDFLVYKSAGRLSNVIRCMASGKSLGLSGADCSGPTGLADWADNFSETEGCENGNDNYLKSLEVLPGEVYYILVSNYRSVSACELNIYGTAEFSRPHFLLQDSLELCQNYDFRLFVPKVNGVVYTWELFDTASESFLDQNNILGNRFAVNTSEPGAYIYRLKYAFNQTICQEAFTNEFKLVVTDCPECRDGIKNGEETDVDCGGPYCPQCKGCELILNLDITDITVYCEQNYQDTSVLLGSYCNQIYEASLLTNLVEESCSKTLTKVWTFELPDTSIRFTQKVLFDYNPQILNKQNAQNAHVQCRDDLPQIADLYVIDPCTGERIEPDFVQNEGHNQNGDTLVFRTWTFAGSCQTTVSYRQEILIRYTEGLKFSEVPSDTVLDCRLEIPSPPNIRLKRDCFTWIEPLFTERIEIGACTTQILRSYDFSIEGVLDTTFSYSIFLIDTVPPEPTFIPTPIERFICINDTVATPLLFAEDACSGPVVPIFSMTNNGGLGTKDSPLEFKKTWVLSDQCGNKKTLTQDWVISNDEKMILPEAPRDTVLQCIEELPVVPVLVASVGCGQKVEASFKEVMEVTGCLTEITRTWTFSYLDLESQKLVQKLIIKPTQLPAFENPSDTLIACTDEIPGLELGSPGNVITACNLAYSVNYSDVFLEDSVCAGSGIINRNWRVIDDCGNQSSSTQIIQTVDRQAPVPVQEFGDILIACQQDIPLFEPGKAIDLCSGAVIEASIIETNNGGGATPDDHLVIQRQRIFSDGCGNSKEFIQTITVTGSEEVLYPPVPANLTVSCLAEVPLAEKLIATNGCDNRLEGKLQESLSGDSCYMEIIRSWTFAFPGLEEHKFSQIITVINQTKPDFLLPADITISCEADSGPDATGWPTKLETHCFASYQIAYTDQDHREICTGTGSWKREWKVTDACGNINTKIQTIHIQDTNPPILPEPPQIQYSPCVKTPLLDLQAVDACSGIIEGKMVLETSNGGGAYPGNPEIFIRTYEFKDFCGNRDSLFEEVWLIGTEEISVDAVSPDYQVSCIEEVVDPGKLRAINSCGQIMEVNPMRTIAGDTLCEAEITFTWEFQFPGVETIMRSQKVKISNQDLPVFTLPSDIQISCESSIDPMNTGYPIEVGLYCGVSPEISFKDTVIEGDCNQSSIIQRNWVSTDRCGNQYTAKQVIDVRDQTAPVVLGAPENLLIKCMEEVPAVQSEFFQLVDLCDSNPFVQHQEDVVSDYVCENQFTIHRNYLVSDACGNTTSYVQVIEVRDSEAPVIFDSPLDLNVSCQKDVPLPDLNLIVSIDNCNGEVKVLVGEDEISNVVCDDHYTIQRTYYARDICGNQTSKTQKIFVKDELKPVIESYPGDITVGCAEEIPLVNVNQIFAFDNCGGEVEVSLEADEVTNYICSNQFTLIRTFVAKDNCGNQESVSQRITVHDDVKPVIQSIPADIRVNCKEDIPIPDVNEISAYDNCGIVPEIHIEPDFITNGACDNQFIVNRKFVVIDACGNQTEAFQEIIIDDQIDPIILSMPADLEVSCKEEVPLPNVNLIQASDNCTNATIITVVPDVTTEYACENQYTIQRQYIATDACGNSTTAIQTIRIHDDKPPLIQRIPADMEVSCSTEIPQPNIDEVQAIDQCGTSITVGVESDIVRDYVCANQFTVNRKYTATDACGNQSEAVQTILVNDQTPPEILSLPEDLVLDCADDIPIAIPEAVNAQDNCSESVEVNFESDLISDFECENRFTIVRKYVATDICGNTSVASQKIIVYDQTPPTIQTIPADLVVDCADDVPPAEIGGVLASDNCASAPVITVVADVISNYVCVNQYTITRSYKATDLCGNVTEASQLIVVDDQSSPVIQVFPEDISVSCTEEVPQANPNAIEANDNCFGLLETIVEQDLISQYLCANQYTISRNYVVSDACGNQTERSQTIWVNDQSAPTIISIPLDLEVSCPSDVPSSDLNAVIATDNCSLNPTISVDSDVVSQFVCAGQYTLLRRYIATDACGFTAEAIQTIRVNDQLAPEINSIPSDMTVSCSDDVPLPDLLAVVAQDNCLGAPAISVEADQISQFICVNQFEITRRYVATDACGNQAAMVQTIVVRDLIEPSIQFLPTDLNVACAEDVPSPDLQAVIAVDNCIGSPEVSVESDIISQYICANQYTISRNYVATDVCGNQSTATQTITVIDDLAPTIQSIPQDMEVACADDVPPPQISGVIAFDNCVTSPEISVIPDVIGNYLCKNQYIITRKYLATDVCGNVSEASQTIRVFDPTPPTIQSIPADLYLSCFEEVPLSNIQAVVVAEDCGDVPLISVEPDVITNYVCVNQYEIYRKYIATDACGNQSEANQFIKIQDETSPIIYSIPSDLEVGCVGDVPASETEAVVAYDNCIAPLSISVDPDVISEYVCENQYTILRKYVATDLCGNQNAAYQIIRVNDQTPPSILSIPTDLEVTCTEDVPLTNIQAVNAIDNCGSSPTIGVEPDIITNYVCANQYTISRKYIARDACGYTDEATQTIRVNDQTAPTIQSIPFDLIVSCAEDVPGSNTNAVLAYDNCVGIPSVTVNSDVISNYECVNRYTVTRTYIVTDICGNQTEASQTIDVDDQIAPVITSIPPDLEITCADDVPLPNTLSVSAYDNCNVVPEISVNDDVISNYICANQFLITRKYVATDICGNRVEADQTIRVNDLIRPTMQSIPSDLVIDCAEDVPNTDIGAVIAYDNCSEPTTISVEADQMIEYVCANQFTLIRKYVATDVCGNQNDADQIIRVNDRTAPTVFSIPSDIEVGCAEEVPNPNTNAVISYDNCQEAPFITVDSDVINSYVCPNKYTIHRRYISTDVCGNQNDAYQIIQVNDRTSPTIYSIPADTEVSCTDEVPSPNIIAVAAYDNCGSLPTITVDSDIISNYVCANQFTISRRYIATDACGNFSYAQQTIRVNDQTAPTIQSIPGDVIVDCAADVPNTNVFGVSAYDNCNSALSITVEQDEVSNYICANQFTISRKYIATDLCGNQTDAIQLIQVHDITAPTIQRIPFDLEVSCSEDVPNTDIGFVAAYDNCNDATDISVDADVITNYVCDNQYTITRRYVATDICGNQNDAYQIIRVNDRIAPTIDRIPFDLEVSCAEEVPNPDLGFVLTYDNCSNDPSISVESDVISNYICANQYTITRRYVSKDICGNQNDAYQIIRVNDKTIPVIYSIPSDLQLSCAEDVPGPNIGAVYATDNCNSSPIISVESDAISNYTCANRFTITRRYIATDICGNQNDAYQIIQVNDQTIPVIQSIPSDLLVNCAEDVPNPNTTAVNAHDNCSALPIITVDSDVISNYICANQYTISRRYVATDICGNQSDAYQLIQVNDQTAPSIQSIPTDFEVSCSQDVPPANTSLVVAYDNCISSPVITVEADVVTNYVCVNQYNIIRKYLATDACGNFSEAVQTITVNDRTSPSIISMPPNLTVSCSTEVPGSNVNQVAATDNCFINPSISVLSDVISNQTCANNYTITRQYVATDACGNTSSANQRIIVNDLISPEFQVPADMTVDCDLSIPQGTPLSGLFAQDCSPLAGRNYEDEVLGGEGNPSDPMYIRRTYTVFDVCGNAAFGSQILTLIDENPGYVIGDTDLKCPGESSIVRAYGGSSYHWSTGQTSQNISVSPSLSTPYIVGVTNSNGCTTYAGHEVRVYHSGHIQLTYSSSNVVAYAPNATQYVYTIWINGMPTMFNGPNLQFTPGMTSGFLAVSEQSCLIGNINISIPSPQQPTPSCNPVAMSIQTLTRQISDTETAVVYYLSCGSENSPARDSKVNKRANSTSINGSEVACGSCEPYNIIWNVNPNDISSENGCYVVAKPGVVLHGSATICFNNNLDCCFTVYF